MQFQTELERASRTSSFVREGARHSSVTHVKPHRIRIVHDCCQSRPCYRPYSDCCFLFPLLNPDHDALPQLCHRCMYGTLRKSMTLR
ncbi:hypothetical protein CGRA01v4_12111 [Colletotrichum graminicola]|nr:hypothetical protein CGRA01v4_12111 [Colletotrichum graminicola]